MKKDKAWLIKRVENYIPLNDKTVGHVVDNILDIIHQLDEPEVLSQEWIKDNTQLDMNPTSRVVPAFLLENLLVPKQEEEQKYYIVDKNDEVLWYRDNKGIPRLSGSTLRSVLKSDSKGRYQFTEQEIKDYDERFWSFAEPVEVAE